MAFDTDEIQARNNGVASIMYLNQLGGNVWIAKMQQRPPPHRLFIATRQLEIQELVLHHQVIKRLSVIGSTNYTGAVLRSVVNYSNTLNSTTIETKAIVGILLVDDAFGTVYMVRVHG